MAAPSPSGARPPTWWPRWPMPTCCSTCLPTRRTSRPGTSSPPCRSDPRPDRPRRRCENARMTDSPLPHLDADGRARMVDVGEKAVTTRTALARGRLETTSEVVALLVADGLPKADALATARIAGITGAKRTSDLIPLCHPLPLDGVTVDLVPDGDGVVIEARTRTSGKTGVEMEALTAVAIAGLTLHDMVKAVDPRATLSGVQLVEKTGGKRGDWTRDSAD